MENLEIKIKYMHEDTKRLQKIEQGDWIDVYADADIFIDEGEYALIPLGFACQLPEGYEAHLAPRSSTFKNWGIIVTNSFGIIDESYCGDNDQWHLPVFCLKGKEEYSTGEYFEIRKRGTSINRGDKIAQFRIIKKMPPVIFTETQHLNNSDRGGFGSTGTK